MKKIEITENFGRYRKGQVIEMNDFDVGHALGFRYGRLYAGRVIETQSVEPPESRVIDHVHEAPEDIYEDVERNKVMLSKNSIFKRRNRKPKP